MNQRGAGKIALTRRSYSGYKNSMLKCKRTFSQQSTRILEEEMSWLKEKINPPPSSFTDSPFPFPQAPEVVISCEFRINGQIGELGQKK